MGIKTRLGNQWSRSPILKLLRNYTYTGNLLQQRTYRENHITKKCIINQGEKPMYLAEGTHVHMARPNGRFCGAKRPKCEAEQPLGFD
ncbi:recombinase family protein [Dorea sp. YH-dor228]